VLQGKKLKGYRVNNFTWKRLLLAAIASLVCLPGSLVYALGLGELQHKSFIGEPFSGVINIVGSELLPEDSVLVRQLNEKEANELGVELFSSHHQMRFSTNVFDGVVKSISISSPQAITEPYLSVLVELKWTGGVVFREYALLFDAPPARGASVNLSANKIKPEAETNSNPNPRNNNFSRSNSSVKEEVTLGSGYTVKAGDTLSGIVSRVERPTGVSENEMIEAVFEGNPNAFFRSDINALKAGARLQLPSQPTLSRRTQEPRSTGFSQESTNNKATPQEPVEEQNNTQTEQYRERLGRLSLSEGGEALEQGADYDVPQIREKIDGTQEMIDMLVRENQDLRERIDKIESSEYLTTLSELVAMQRNQIDELREEFRAQANPGTNNSSSFQEDGTSVSAPIPTIASEAELGSNELSFSQKLAQNFWSFISLLVFVFIALILLCVYVVRKWTESQQEHAEYTQYRDSIESKVDLDSFVGIKESANIAVEAEKRPANVTTMESAIDSRRQKSLQQRMTEQEQETKRKLDNEVKERIRLKTNEYNSAPSPEPTSAMHVDIDVVGFDSEARAILSAQHREDSDPRLIDALEQIDKLERGEEA